MLLSVVNILIVIMSKLNNILNMLIRKVFLSLTLCFSTISYGQALIAKAEIKANSIALNKTGFDLYDNWNNTTHYRGEYIPEKYNINVTDFTMPIKHSIVTSHYGKRWNRMHKGTDIKAYHGDTVRAAFSGKVRVVKNNPKGYGLFVIIRHHNGLETYYGHLSKQLVKENQEVHSGQPIGLAGNTGRSTGTHLHFETRLCGRAIDPEHIFNFKMQDITQDVYTFKR